MADTDIHKAAQATPADLRLSKAEAENTRLREEWSFESDRICQTLGRVLGFPWFKDDQKNFPGATEADGVCIAEAHPEWLADMAANRIKVQDETIAKLREALEPFGRHANRFDTGYGKMDVGAFEVISGAGIQVGVTVGDLRRARAVLTETADIVKKETT